MNGTAVRIRASASQEPGDFGRVEQDQYRGSVDAGSRRVCSSLMARVGRPPLPEMFLPRAAHSRTHGAAPPSPARLRQTPWAAPQSGPLEAGLPSPASLAKASPIDKSVKPTSAFSRYWTRDAIVRQLLYGVHRRADAAHARRLAVLPRQLARGDRGAGRTARPAVASRRCRR